jgi:hypothetical protein
MPFGGVGGLPAEGLNGVSAVGLAFSRGFLNITGELGLFCQHTEAAVRSELALVVY